MTTYNGQNWLPTLFNDLFDNEWPVMKQNRTAPAVNVSESKTEYKVEVAAPGMTKEDFSIQLSNDNELSIMMEKKSDKKDEDKGRKYLRREFSYAKYEQSFVLPDDVDKEKISASMTDGVLNITLPKLTVEEKAKVNHVIEIK